jgi:hypothetical protein
VSAGAPLLLGHCLSLQKGITVHPFARCPFRSSSAHATASSPFVKIRE